jgi:hypothetical protein
VNAIILSYMLIYVITGISKENVFRVEQHMEMEHKEGIYVRGVIPKFPGILFYFLGYVAACGQWR